MQIVYDCIEPKEQKNNKKQDHIQSNLEYILFYAPAIFTEFKMF